MRTNHCFIADLVANCHTGAISGSFFSISLKIVIVGSSEFVAEVEDILAFRAERQKPTYARMEHTNSVNLMLNIEDHPQIKYLLKRTI